MGPLAHVLIMATITSCGKRIGRQLRMYCNRTFEPTVVQASVCSLCDARMGFRGVGGAESVRVPTHEYTEKHSG
eukprot:945866-Prorocentrum_minimum.AAC.9